MVGGVFALLLRMKLMYPGQELFSDKAYNVFFTLHGIMMIFLFIIPAIPSALGNFFIPLLVGARDVASPADYIQLSDLPCRYHRYPVFPGEPTGHRLDLLHPLLGQDRGRRHCPLLRYFPGGHVAPSSPV